MSSCKISERTVNLIGDYLTAHAITVIFMFAINHCGYLYYLIQLDIIHINHTNLVTGNH